LKLGWKTENRVEEQIGLTKPMTHESTNKSQEKACSGLGQESKA
jgi:hypothetical protein